MLLWPPDVKNWLIGKDPDAGKDWGQEEKQMTEDGLVGWHHRLNGHEFEQPPGVGDGQGNLACCNPWGLKELIWLSNWTVCYNILQAHGRENEAGQVIAPTEDRIYPSNTEKKEVANFCFHGPYSPLFLMKTQVFKPRYNSQNPRWEPWPKICATKH